MKILNGVNRDKNEYHSQIRTANILALYCRSSGCPNCCYDDQSRSHLGNYISHRAVEVPQSSHEWPTFFAHRKNLPPLHFIIQLSRSGTNGVARLQALNS